MKLCVLRAQANSLCYKCKFIIGFYYNIKNEASNGMKGFLRINAGFSLSPDEIRSFTMNEKLGFPALEDQSMPLTFTKSQNYLLRKLFDIGSDDISLTSYRPMSFIKTGSDSLNPSSRVPPTGV